MPMFSYGRKMCHRHVFVLLCPDRKLAKGERTHDADAKAADFIGKFMSLPAMNLSFLLIAVGCKLYCSLDQWSISVVSLVEPRSQARHESKSEFKHCVIVGEAAERN